MFLNKKIVDEMIKSALKVFKEDELSHPVKCEHSKLLGMKEDMVEKTLRLKDYANLGYRLMLEDTEKTIYFSPAFAPKWDIKDIRDKYKVRYYKKVEAKEVEVKID